MCQKSPPHDLIMTTPSSRRPLSPRGLYDSVKSQTLLSGTYVKFGGLRGARVCKLPEATTISFTPGPQPRPASHRPRLTLVLEGWTIIPKIKLWPSGQPGARRSLYTMRNRNPLFRTQLFACLLCRVPAGTRRRVGDMGPITHTCRRAIFQPKTENSTRAKVRIISDLNGEVLP